MKSTGSFFLKVTTPGDREIVMVREFAAPRRLVWEAMSKPELIERWLFGPPGWTMTTCEEDQRVGGAFHWAWTGPEGAAMSMRGVYREVVPGERLVRTETFETGCEGQAGQQIASIELAEKGGRTTLTLTVLFPSKEARDATIASGMEHGVSAGYDRLERLLSSLGEPARAGGERS